MQGLGYSSLHGQPSDREWLAAAAISYKIG